MHRLTRQLAVCFAISLICAFAGACGEDPAPPDAAVLPDAPPAVGTVSLQWQITDGTNMLTCEDVSGLTVRVEVTPVNGQFGSSDTFSCDVGMATTRLLDVDTYNIDVDLSAFTETGTASLLQRDENGPSCVDCEVNGIEVSTDQDTPLDPITFQVIPQGTVQFQVDTDVMGPNCEPEANGGAGLTELRLELLDRDGVCDPNITFDVAAGMTQPAGSYANCAATGACIENDQVITATIPSGASKMLQITGLEGVFDCYRGVTQFNAPGNNLAAPELSLMLADLLSIDCEM